jgi:uncharacterized protein
VFAGLAADSAQKWCRLNQKIGVCRPVFRGFSAPASGGAEVDLLLALPRGQLWAIEIKRSLSPKVERGFHAACEDLSPARKLVVYPGAEPIPLGNDVYAMPLEMLCRELSAM